MPEVAASPQPQVDQAPQTSDIPAWDPKMMEGWNKPGKVETPSDLNDLKPSQMDLDGGRSENHGAEGAIKKGDWIINPMDEKGKLGGRVIKEGVMILGRPHFEVVDKKGTHWMISEGRSMRADSKPEDIQAARERMTEENQRQEGNLPYKKEISELFSRGEDTSGDLDAQMEEAMSDALDGIEEDPNARFRRPAAASQEPPAGPDLPPTRDASSFIRPVIGERIVLPSRLVPIPRQEGSDLSQPSAQPIDELADRGREHFPDIDFASDPNAGLAEAWRRLDASGQEEENRRWAGLGQDESDISSSPDGEDLDASFRAGEPVPPEPGEYKGTLSTEKLYTGVNGNLLTADELDKPAYERTYGPDKTYQGGEPSSGPSASEDADIPPFLRERFGLPPKTDSTPETTSDQPEGDDLPPFLRGRESTPPGGSIAAFREDMELPESPTANASEDKYDWADRGRDQFVSMQADGSVESMPDGSSLLQRSEPRPLTEVTQAEPTQVLGGDQKDETQVESVINTEPNEPKERGGLFSWFRRGKKEAPKAEETKEELPNADLAHPVAEAAQAETETPRIDPVVEGVLRRLQAKDPSYELSDAQSLVKAARARIENDNSVGLEQAINYEISNR